MWLKLLESIEKKEYIKKNYTLENISAVLTFLNEPHKKLKNVIHITGTNGKGSVAYYTANILQSLGYTVGSFTSPHVVDFTQRICINNNPISIKEVEKYLKQIFTIKTYKNLNLTYFELLSCIMFLYFAEKQPDFSILEVGLGGKLDATNVVPHSIISVLTSISLDHTEVLGKTEYQILKDKSGIIKPDSICICAEQKKFVKKYLKKLCNKQNTELWFVDKNRIKNVKYDFHRWETQFDCITLTRQPIQVKIPMCSIVQPLNVLISIDIVTQLFQKNFIKKLDFEKIKSAVDISIPLRMQPVILQYENKNIRCILDAAHNPQAIKNFVNTIKLSSVDNIVICFALMRDKDYKSIARIFKTLKNRIRKIVFYRLPIDRVQDPAVLYSEFKKFFPEEKLAKFEDLSSVLNYIKNFNNIFFVGTFYVGKFLQKYIKN